MPGPAQADALSGGGLFESGKVAMHLTGDWGWWNFPGLEEEFNWAVAALPYGGPDRRCVVFADPWMLSATTDHPDEAWEFLKHLASPEVQRGWMELVKAPPGQIRSDAGRLSLYVVDDWPVITWSVLDYDRQPKAGFSALQTAMQPVLPSVNATLPERLDGRRWVCSAPDRITISLSVVNDTLDAYLDAKLCWRIDDGDGQTVQNHAVRVNVRADEARSVTSLRPSQLTPGNYSLSVELNDTQGQLLGQNTFEFAILPEEQQ